MKALTLALLFSTMSTTTFGMTVVNPTSHCAAPSATWTNTPKADAGTSPPPATPFTATAP